MFKGTTPTCTLTFDDESVDFTEASNIIVTIADRSKNVLLELDSDSLEITSQTIDFDLTQAQTLSFPKGENLVQVNWTYDSDGETKRACSNIVTVTFKTNLHDEVME